MAGWFAKLMQQGHAASRRATIGAKDSTQPEVGSDLDARRARFDAIVQKLRDREAEDRDGREKRQRGYKQTLDSVSDVASAAAIPTAPTRLHRFRTKVPCRVTPEARAVLDELRKQFPGGTVTFPHAARGRQAVMLDGSAGTWPKQIGWVEHCVQTDPSLCNVRHQGLSVETDDGAMLVLRFRYPSTAVRVCCKQNAEEKALPDSSRRFEEWASPPQMASALELPCGSFDEVASVDFSEVRPALDLRPPEKSAAPRLVWFRRSEVDTINAVGSRDYEAFYVRFKLELLAGIWSSLSGALSEMPSSRLHGGSCYTVMCEPDAGNGRIYQRTFDDGGNAVDIGFNRIYNAAAATDILLLYLEGDILADFADIYFTLQSFRSAEAYFLKEELFAIIRRFWASSQSLTSDYGSDLAAIVRMSQRALPTPAQAPLLKQDWTNLRQSVVDRYGEAGRKAGDLAVPDAYRPRVGPSGWPFASYPAGEVNIGLRLVYRQEWRYLGAQRGEVIRTVCGIPDLTSAGASTKRDGDSEQCDGSVVTVRENATTTLDAIVEKVADATVEAMKWPLDVDGSINTGVRELAATTEMGLEAECRESSRETGARLTDIVSKLAGTIRVATTGALAADSEETLQAPPLDHSDNATERRTVTHVYSRLQKRYEILTRPAEIQNVVLVAEKLPAPAEIDVAWVRRHDWILAQVLLDESFRDALETMGDDARLDASVRADLDAKRERLFGHLRANILHYQRAIWQREDPQQRRMRYRKSGRKVPLEWRFELESGGGLSIDELVDRLAASNVDGQFAAYSSSREADLDQVIDPAGPIGYYGNYAVYQMRAELGSEDLFSMLHFFKSPYLRANPETGEPEVADPMQIELAESPAVASNSFRRERARRIALETDGVVIDVGPSTALLDDSDSGDGAVDQSQVPEGYELILDSGRDVALLSATRPRDAEEWMILRCDAERSASLRTGQPQNPEADDVIRVRVEDGQRLTSAFSGADSASNKSAILPRSDDERVTAVWASRLGNSESERVVPPRDARELILESRAAGETQELEILANDDGVAAPTVLAGVGAAVTDQRVINARDDESLIFASPAAAGDAPSDERLLFARNGGETFSTGSIEQSWLHDVERLILARGDVTLRLTSIAGGGAAAGDEQMIVVGGGGERTPSLLAGAGAGRVHKRLILVPNDEWLRPSLVAG